MPAKGIEQKIKDSQKCLDKLGKFKKVAACNDLAVCVGGELEDLEELKAKLSKARKYKKVYVCCNSWEPDMIRLLGTLNVP